VGCSAVQCSGTTRKYFTLGHSHAVLTGHLTSFAEAMANIRVDMIHYEVKDLESAVRAGRLWMRLSRVAVHTARLLHDLNTIVLAQDDQRLAAQSLTTKAGVLCFMLVAVLYSIIIGWLWGVQVRLEEVQQLQQLEEEQLQQLEEEQLQQLEQLEEAMCDAEVGALAGTTFRPTQQV
jgi:hypothetical protein